MAKNYTAFFGTALGARIREPMKDAVVKRTSSIKIHIF